VTLNKALIVLAVITAAIVVAWKVNYPSYSFNYKITVEVETPEGLKSGSAVREVTVVRQPKIGDAPSVIFDVRGEAVVVDLGERGVVFSLINWDSDRDVYHAFKTIRREDLKTGMKAVLSENPHFPRFMTFSDLNDPKSIMSIDRKMMSKTFGEGVKFKQISIEITDEPVTRGVSEKYLPSFGDETGFYQWLSKLEFSDPRRITRANF
jgi:hypothetical protein